MARIKALGVAADVLDARCYASMLARRMASRGASRRWRWMAGN